MNVHDFIRKWSDAELRERQGSQEHFLDLCRLLGQKTPAEADPKGDWYCFEKGAAKQTGGEGWADVWRKGHFAWEYKGPRRDLEAAYRQLLLYRESLENPPLLVVSDMARFQIHTNFTGTPKIVHEFVLADLVRKEVRDKLLALFEDPERLRPGRRVEEVTEEAASRFATLAEGLRSRGVEPRQAAHFLNKILFCLFAEDVGLLPKKLIERLVDASDCDPEKFVELAGSLFRAMEGGGNFGVERIRHFDGGLFSESDAFPLSRDELKILAEVARLDWSQIEPAIFGTLFERGLDPSKRSQLGAHYTDRASILRIIDPVLMAPLRREWERTCALADQLLAKVRPSGKPLEETGGAKKALKAIEAFRSEHLDKVVVLDPACGSGNFLYVALERLHELEKEVLLKITLIHRKHRILDVRVGPHMVKGIEINSYAHELAQVTIWIGHLQWHVKNGFGFSENPVLKPIQTIECRDAILARAADGVPVEADWPAATAVVGNPPFLGGKKMRAELGDAYVDDLFRVYAARVPPEADLVTYWFEKARAAIKKGTLRRAGLLATQGIRGGASRKVLDGIRKTGRIFMAWRDEPWVVEGASVRISLVGFDNGEEQDLRLDGKPVAVIHSDLTGAETEAAAVDLTRARRIRENLAICFMGDTKGGAFDVSGTLAREWLDKPNPHGRSNADVLRPWMNSIDLMRRPRDMWVIDFGVEMPEHQARLYEAPFQYILKLVKNQRGLSRTTRKEWWIHERPRPDLRDAVAGKARFVVTPAVAKHRVFSWLPSRVLPDHALLVFARDDDWFLGILHSAVHETWTRRKGTQVREAKSGFRYTPTSCFETFPFPQCCGGVCGQPSDTGGVRLVERITTAARTLVELRDGWLNPPGASAAELKMRTFTNLYNARPAWIEHAHLELDRAVLAAYGWPETWAEGLQPKRDDIGRVNPELGVIDPAVHQELLAKLLALNQQQAGA